MAFGRLGQAKKLMQLRSQQKKLAKLEVEVEEDGVLVVASGDQKIKRLEIDGQADKKLVDVLNKALKKSQKAAAKQSREALGDILGF